MPVFVGDQSNNNNHSNDGSKVKKLLAHVQSAVLPRRISFNKSSSISEEPKIKTVNNISITQPRENNNSKEKEKEAGNEDGFQGPKKVLFPKSRVDGIHNNPAMHKHCS